MGGIRRANVTTEQNAYIVSQTAMNIPSRKIGEKLGISPNTVCVRRKALKDLIERETARLIESGLAIARKGIVRAAAETLHQFNAKDRQEEYDTKLIEIGINASKTLLASAGLTGQPSMIMNNLIQINSGNQIPEAISRVLSQIAMADTGRQNLLECDDAIDI